MIVDTSALIDWLLRRETPATVKLSEAMQRKEDIAILPCILQEALQGARSPVVLADLAEELNVFAMLLVKDPPRIAKSAAEVYARCRWMGFTPRSPNDCLIAASCIELDQPLLHSDRDFEQIAESTHA